MTHQIKDEADHLLVSWQGNNVVQVIDHQWVIRLDDDDRLELAIIYEVGHRAKLNQLV